VCDVYEGDPVRPLAEVQDIKVTVVVVVVMVMVVVVMVVVVMVVTLHAPSPPPPRHAPPPSRDMPLDQWPPVLHARVLPGLVGGWGLGFGVWGLGFGVWGLGFGVWGLGNKEFGSRVWILVFRFYFVWFSGLEFRV